MSDDHVAGRVEVLADGTGALASIGQHSRIRRARITHMLALPGGMVGGRASVGIVGRLKDGSYALLETSLRIALLALRQWEAHYGVEADGTAAQAPTGLTAERLNAAMLMQLIRDREGQEVTFEIDALNAVMQDVSQGVEIEYGKDGKTITVRIGRSE